MPGPRGEASERLVAPVSLGSTMPMPNLALTAVRVQAPIAGAPFHEWSSSSGASWTQFYRTEGGYLLRFPDLADFDVSVDGQSVVCSPAPDVAEATSLHLYLNQVLPLVLSKLGNLVFHASAVEVGEGAVAFVGESGRGKSTLAACLAMDGRRIVADDGLVVAASGEGYRVLPSHPSLRLWEDSERALMAGIVDRAPALPFTAKVRLLAGRTFAFSERPVPLRHAYFLGDGSAKRPSIRRMSAAEALVEWTKHSFLLDVHAPPALASHFDRVAALAAQPIHYRVDFPRRFDELPRVRQAIVAHARGDGDLA